MVGQYLQRLAALESNDNPFAQNPVSTAKGRYQFINSTGEAYGITAPFGTPEYLKQEELAAKKFTEDNRNALRMALGREPVDAELYLAHQQGAAGAAKLLTNPQARAADIVGQEAIVNNGGTADMTAEQFSKKWLDKFGNTQPAADTAPQQDLVDVQMPDGTVIKDVPPNISKVELLGRLQKNGFDTSGFEAATPAQPAPDIAQPEPETAGEMDLSGPQEPQSALMALPEDSLIRRAGAAARTGAQGLSFGTLDEIQAAAATLPTFALKNLFTDDKVSLGETYDHLLGTARNELGGIREDYPIQSLGTEIAGGVATGSAAGKIAGAVAPKAMGALAQFAAANPIKAGAGIAAGTGGLYGFNEGEGGFGERAGDAAQSALLSVPFGAGGGFIAGKLGSRGAPVAATNIADDLAGAADNVAAAPIATQNTGSALAQFTPEQEVRRGALAAVGIAPEQQTAGMITRDPKVWQFEQNTKGIQGVGDEIRNRYIQANETIKNALNQVGVKTGGKATTPYEAGESVTNAVTKKSKEMQAEVGRMYGQIRDEIGGDPGLVPNKLVETIAEASDNAYADNIVNSMARKMTRYGLIDKKTGAVADGAQLTVSQAEELRKFANTLRGDKQTDHIVGNIIDALDDDVIDTAGTDAFKTARDAARARFKEFETKILGGITDGKLVSDDVLSRTSFGGKVKDLQALKETLTTGTDEQIARGAEAWSDLKLQTLQKVIDDSSSAGGKLSGAAFDKQLRKIGKERMETLFDPEELLQLRTIQKALEYTTIEVPESVVNYSNTGAANANNALAGILKRSRLGEFLEKGSEKVSSVPVFGPLASPVLKFTQGGGQLMQDAARSKSIRNVLKPDSALRRLADPATVGRAGVSGGVMATDRE